MKPQLAQQEQEYKETELGQLPKEWDVVKLGTVFDIQQGKQLSAKEDKTGKIKIPFLRTSNIFWGKVDLSKMDYMFFSEKEVLKLQLLNNDVLVCEGGDVGRTALWREELKGCLYQNHLYRLRPKKDYNSLFFVFWMEYAITSKGLYLATANRTTIPNISASRLREFIIPKPEPSEQKKIVFVLSTIQEAGEKTKNVINSLKELKKSLMKHLFAYGAVSFEDVKKVKLKETEIGKVPEDWRVVKLGDLIQIKGGKRLPKGHNFSEKKTAYPYIRIVDFKDNNINLKNLKFLNEEDREKIKRYIINNEDVYISIAGTIGLIGIIPKELNGANLTENAARLIIKNKEKLDKSYLVYFLSSNIGQKEIEVRTTKTSQPKLALMRIQQIPTSLPPLPEQQQIASILSTVDEKVEAEENKKKALDELFKSMLHNLMTAKIRVNDMEI